MNDCYHKEKKKDEAVYLRRKITLLRSVGITIGTIIGSGIFISPKGVLKNSGNVGLSLIMWLLCGILSMFGALSFAELGITFTKSGGNYIYLKETLGPLVAFLYIWAESISTGPANGAVIVLAFAHYFLEYFLKPCVAPPLAVKFIALLAYYISVALNCWSISWSARLITFLSFTKLMALTLVIVPGMVFLSKGHFENFHDAFDSSNLALDKLPLVFFAGMFSYSGWTLSVNFREELVNPRRTIPLTVVLSLSIITIGYLLTNISYYTVLTVDEILNSDAVAVTFAERISSWLSSVIQLLVALSCIGTLNGGLFSSARTTFVASRERQWPLLFSMIHIRRHTPLPAVLFKAPLVTFMVFQGDLYSLLNFFSFSRWLFIGLAIAGLIIHRYRHPDLPRPFKLPLFIPVIFTIICLSSVAMSLYSAPRNCAIGFLIILTGMPVYYLLIYRPIPASVTTLYSYLTIKLQTLLEVVLQEIHTY
uniref:Cystine/glutamate transporter n=1 Tax=Geotrypetes seraphini TaxID=260995 RepID=A0A6P8RS00_GEOSA|nr:cystine/glutamate transporter-like [Geotrypetes seraphini]XP_033807721.1 cystine/glutamate transporter-like [Geotrypetes seraphini]